MYFAIAFKILRKGVGEDVHRCWYCYYSWPFAFRRNNDKGLFLETLSVVYNDGTIQ